MPKGVPGPVAYDATLKRRGTHARENAQDRAGSGRITKEAWYPSIVQLLDYGYTQVQIAWAIGLSDRMVRDIVRWGREEGKDFYGLDREPQSDPSKLPARFQQMMEFTGEAFKDFYEYCTDRDLPDHCKTWVQEFIDNKLLLLNVPPRHMKSTIFSLWVPIWLLCRNRDEQIILLSKTNDLATRWASDIANQLEFNTRITNVWGRFAPERSRNSPWRPARGQLLVLGRQREARGMQMSVLARGSGQQILGMEATVVIADDITDARTASSETEREREMNWLRDECFTRLETESMSDASGRAVIIGQRVHYQDIYGQLAQLVQERGKHAGEPLFRTIVNPAVYDWDKGLTLWPEKWNIDELTYEYNRVGSATFSVMFQQEPLPPDARLVKPEWWERCRQLDRPGGQGYKKRGPGGEFLPVARVVSLDPSPKRYNGLVVADVVFDRETFTCAIIEAIHFVGGLRDIKAQLLRVVEEYGPDYFIMEHSTFTSWFTEDPFYNQLKNRVKCIPHQTYRNKGDEELGFESLAGDVEAGRILLPYGDPWGIEMSTLLEDELNKWPFGSHDDVGMSVWFIKWNYRKLIPRGVYTGHFQGAPNQSSGWSFMQRPPTRRKTLDERLAGN